MLPELSYAELDEDYCTWYCLWWLLVKAVAEAEMGFAARLTYWENALSSVQAPICVILHFFLKEENME